MRVHDGYDDGSAITARRSPLNTIPDRETAGLWVTRSRFDHGNYDPTVIEDTSTTGNGADAFLDGNTPSIRVNWANPFQEVEVLQASAQVNQELASRAALRQPNTQKNRAKKRTPAMRTDRLHCHMVETRIAPTVCRRQYIPFSYEDPKSL